MKKALRLILISALSLALAGALILPLSIAAPQEPSGSGGPSIEPEGGSVLQQAVKVTSVGTGHLRTWLDFTGEVMAETSVEIFPDVGGKIVSLPVNVGDRVVRGQTVIAEIDPSRPGAPFSNYRLFSSITGTVTALTSQIGSTVSPATSVATVGVLDGLQVSLLVPETRIAGLIPGLQAEIRFTAYQGETFGARIDRISPVIDPASRTLRVSLKFDRQDRRILPGLFAQVRLFMEPHPRRVLVPQESVVSRDGKSVVFLYSDDKVVRQEVMTGRSSDGMTEITRGLVAGQQLVVQGQENLEDGMAVFLIVSEKDGSQ